ncbi:hypothetical protein [Sphaerisporangium dianthi]|uniref:Uncharacterized protein n=1 Tax=Sphaerisporangium dianthi TaxID=1436120 RepID=A0ABV9CB61_9ACTN
MDVLLAVSGDFDVTAAEIIHSWNMSDDHTRVAVARPYGGRLDHFDAAEFLGSVLVVMGSLASGVAGNALYDLLKAILLPKARGREITYKEIDRPDGTKIIEVHLSENE